jgi:ketosteroid isomerase-like protein
MPTPGVAAGSGSAARPKSALPSTSRDVEAIRAIGRQWRSLYEAGRYAEIPELYTEDTMVMPRGRPRIEGRAAMRKAVGGLAAGRRVSIDVREREAFVAGDYGWFVGDFTVTYQPPGGGAAAVENGRSLVIFRRDRDNVWRIHRDMDNPAPLSAATPAKATPRGATQAQPPVWTGSDRSNALACDRLSASRYDRTRLAPPVAREAIDVPAAIAQCERDLAAHPGDPRLLFQLGRLYGYAGDAAKTRAVREAAAAAGNHNAIFLLGYLDWTAAKPGPDCAAAERMKLAADRGNFSAQVTYTSLFLERKFDTCANVAERHELAAYMRSAKPEADGFFETRLVDHLSAQLEIGQTR